MSLVGSLPVENRKIVLRTDKLMSQQLWGACSHFWIKGKHAFDEIDSLIRDLIIEVKLSFSFVLLKDILIEIFGGAERKVIVKHFIDDDSQRPNVYFLVVVIISCYFWSHVCVWSYFGPSESHLINEAKIYQFYAIFLFVEQNILGLKISVYVSLVVDVL